MYLTAPGSHSISVLSEANVSNYFTHTFCCLFRIGPQLPSKRVSTKGDLVLPLQIYCILSFLKVVQLPLTSSSTSPLPLTHFLLFFLPIMYHIKQFLCKMRPIQYTSLLFIICRICLSSLILCSTYLFLTQYVQMTFSILLQHHIPKLTRYFRSTFRSVQISVPHKAAPQISTLVYSSLNLS